MGRNEKKYGTIGLMILTVIIIFSVVGIVIAGFRMIKKNEDARLISAADTEYNKDKEKRQDHYQGQQVIGQPLPAIKVRANIDPGPALEGRISQQAVHQGKDQKVNRHCQRPGYSHR